MNCPWCDSKPTIESEEAYDYGSKTISYGCHNKKCHVQPRVSEDFNSMCQPGHSQYILYEDLIYNLITKWNSSGELNES